MEMAEGLRIFFKQPWETEFRLQQPHYMLGVILRSPVAPVLWGPEDHWMLLAASLVDKSKLQLRRDLVLKA